MCCKSTLRIKSMYPIIEIPGDVSSQLEQLGTKAKVWYFSENDRKMLFKEGRPGTGENWAEKVCCEICRLLQIPHAEYDLANWNGRKGVISPSFVPEDGRLILGNELLAKIHTDYEERRRFQARQHTLRRVFAALELLQPGHPIDWKTPLGIKDATGVFVGYLLLDALVSNQDRHHENWGLINSLSYGLRLVPTFDHASSLGRNETDEIRMERLQSKDSGHGVRHYCGRAKSGLYKATTDKKPMSTIFAFQEAVKINSAAGRYWLERLSNLTTGDFEAILTNVPGSEISEPAQLFALKMLETNQNRLMNL